MNAGDSVRFLLCPFSSSLNHFFLFPFFGDVTYRSYIIRYRNHICNYIWANEWTKYRRRVGFKWRNSHVLICRWLLALNVSLFPNFRYLWASCVRGYYTCIQNEVQSYEFKWWDIQWYLLYLHSNVYLHPVSFLLFCMHHKQST